MAIEKIKRPKSPAVDQISAELIKAVCRTIRSDIHKLIIPNRNKEELPEEWKESVIVPINNKGDKTDCSNYRGISLLSTLYKILPDILLSRLTPYAEEIICVDLDTAAQLLIIHSAFVKYSIKEVEYNGAVQRLFIYFKKTCDSFWREVLHNILIEFGITMKLIRLVTMCLDETYSRVCVGKHIWA
jgi:hypothetical protein